MSYQQTVLRVQENNNAAIATYTFLDIYTDIPIKITKSFAELQDISKRNSDYSIGLQIPGSKKNNAFFESYFNVDNDTLYFDPTKRVNCDVLIDSQPYFTGYLKLNKVSVLNSKIEYDVTLFSTVADVFGNIGNNLMKDLPFSTPVDGYTSTNNSAFNDTFNHSFNLGTVENWDNDNLFTYDKEPLYFYPVVHNGYEYSGDTVNLSGGTTALQTRLYTSTIVGSYASNAAAYAAGVKRYRINSPQDGLLNNQLKPALNIKGLITLMFQTYGYSIKSDFFNTPWFRLMYMYGYFNSDTTKFSYKIPSPADVNPSNLAAKLTETFVDTTDPVCFQIKTTRTYKIQLVYEQTGRQATSSTPINVVLVFKKFPCNGTPYSYNQTVTIPANATGTTYSWVSNQFIPCPSTCQLEYIQNFGINDSLSDVPEYSSLPPGTIVFIEDNDLVNFSKIFDINLKQIDFLSSIAKKFNLVFIPNPQNPREIIIEPYTYYIGSGKVVDWSDKISFDKGWSVEPAFARVESQITLTDQDDGDYGNKTFKEQNNRIYGQNFVLNPTDFKSQEKKIDTIFSAEFVRQWDTPDTAPNGNIILPLGINYAANSNTSASGDTQRVTWQYKGVKTKPKLFYYSGNYNPFTNTIGQFFNYSGSVVTNAVYIAPSDGSAPTQSFNVPVIGNANKIGGGGQAGDIEDDSIYGLFYSEPPTDFIDKKFAGYTIQNLYSLFYENRIDNLFNKNTRFLNGQFYLKQSDIKNLEAKDLIKINDQLFTWNKIDSFNMTNEELTKCELIQVDNNVQKYPTRYFQYAYCDDPTGGQPLAYGNSYAYKFKTDFTNPSLSGTSFGWSAWFDYNIGLKGSTKRFVATVRDPSQGNAYVAYNITEVSEDYYNDGYSNQAKDRSQDCLYNYLVNLNGDLNYENFPNIIYTNGSPTKIVANVFPDCTTFNSLAAANNILTGSSTTHICVTPTPTPTATPTPTPTPTPIPSTCMSIGTGFNNTIYDIEIQADNKILIGGAAVTYSGNTFDKLIRLNVDGTIDTGFTYNDGTTFTNVVGEILIQPDQKILRRDWNNLRRLNTDGSYDSGFNRVYWDTLGTETIHEEVLGLQSDGKIIVGGKFNSFTSSGTTIVTSTKKYIQRLNTDGTIDSTFNSGGTGFTAATGVTFFAGVQDVLVLPDDKILVAGKFSQYNGTICDNLIKLNADGTVDGTFTIDTSPSDAFGILDIEVQSDGKILVGILSGSAPNNFTYLGYNVYGLFRLNSNGTFDTSFPYNVFSGNTWDIKVLADNSMYIGGEATGQPYSGVTVSNVFKLTSSGVLDTSFNTGTGFSGIVYDVEVDSINRVLAGGNFSTYNGISAGRFVRVLSDGTINICVTATPTPTPTGTPTPTPTATATPTPTPTATATPTPTPTPQNDCYCFPIVVTGSTLPPPEGGTIATLVYNDCFGTQIARAFTQGPGTYYQCIEVLLGVPQYDPIGTQGIDQSYINLTYLTGNCNTGYDCSGYVPASTPTPTPTATATPTPTPTATAEPATPTPTPTSTPTPTPTSTATPTPTPFETTFSGFVSLIDGPSACSGGEYGNVSITVQGTSLCNLTKLVGLPSSVWGDMANNQTFWVSNGTDEREFKRDGSAQTGTAQTACTACAATPTPTPTLPPPTPTPTPGPITSFGGCGYGSSSSAACNDAGINNRTLYSDCDGLTFGVGCVVYTNAGGTSPLTGYDFVYINLSTWDINSSTGIITALSSEQC